MRRPALGWDRFVSSAVCLLAMALVYCAYAFRFCTPTTPAFDNRCAATSVMAEFFGYRVADIDDGLGRSRSVKVSAVVGTHAHLY